MAKENVGTFLLNAQQITIVEEWGVRNASIAWVSGVVTVKGTMKLGALDSIAITLDKTTPPLNISFDFAIDGYEIDASAGSAFLITGK